MFRLRLPALICASFLVAGVACGPSGPTTGNQNDGGVIPTDAQPTSCQEAPGRTICMGTTEVVCDENGVESRSRDCADLSLRCAVDHGCVVCFPGESYCDGNTVMTCRSDWMGWEAGYQCDPGVGESCSDGLCENLCNQAALSRSNVGCDYIAVDMGNIDEGNANEACYVALVSNVQAVGDATVTVEDGQGNLLDFPGHGTHRIVAPGALEVFAISGTTGMCPDNDAASANVTQMTSGIQGGGAYRIKSTLPVVAYQINPYEAANLHTTDAALLIPVPALGSQYMVATYSGLSQSPSEISIVAVEDNTHVHVDPSVALQAVGPVPASGSFDVVLNAMEHLQIVASGTADLTGTLVSAGTVDTEEAVAVFAGAGCADIPVGYHWCDHLEEQLPEVKSWGWTYVAAPPPKRASESAFWRIIAAVDNTQVYFSPNWIVPSSPVTLNRGEVYEIQEADAPFMLYADQDHPVQVMNLMKGAEKTTFESGLSDPDQLGTLRGDPALTLSVPVEQYLDEYIFLSDPTYAYNFVVVVTSNPASTVHLDCLDPIPASKFETVADTYSMATIVLSSSDQSVRATDGSCQGSGSVHHIWSDDPFGIWVYGYYQDTSYGYPGGMNLEQVNDVIIVD